MLTATDRPRGRHRPLVLGLAILTLLSAPARAGEGGQIETELAAVAGQVSAFLNRYGSNTVTVGQFICPPQFNGTAGPGISKILTEDLKEKGIDVKRLADLGIRGEYRLVLKNGPRGPEAQIKGEIEDLEGKKLLSFTRNVRGEATLAYLFGLTVSLPPSENEEARGKRLLASLTAPRTVVQASRVSAGDRSPYAVEVLVREGDVLRPRAPTTTEGLAFVQIRNGETYAVNLVNDSDTDAAVTLTIDGLNMFAFSENTDYRYVIVPRKSKGQILGWYVTDKKSDSFKVTDYGKSAVAQMLPNSSSVGTITATFAAAWPKGSAGPGDEPGPSPGVRGRDATGRGPSVEANYRIVERVVGVTRAAVSVRYTRGD